MINYQKTKLKNGLKILTAPLHETKAVALLVLVKTGSRYETAGKNGLAHFLEHMFFKGTKKRPTTSDISHELDSLGAQYNAFTAEEVTGFWIKVSADSFPTALDLLYDLLYQSKFEEKEIQKEKGVILEEINMYQDTPRSYITDLLKRAFYSNHPLGYDVAGTKETVPKFSRRDLVNFLNNHYRPNNLVISVAGNPLKFNWQDEIRKYFENIAPQKIQKFSAIKISNLKPRLEIQTKKTDQAHLGLGFLAPQRTDPRWPTLKVLNNILGETMSSRLFSEIREKRGLAYYVYSNYFDFSDTGALCAFAGVDLKNIKKVIKITLGEFEKIKAGGVFDKEILRAKENLKGHLYLELEDSMEIGSYLAEQELFWPEILQPEEMVDRIQKVQKSDIIKLAKDIVQKDNLNFAVIGPYQQKEEFEKVLNSTDF